MKKIIIIVFGLGLIFGYRAQAGNIDPGKSAGLDAFTRKCVSCHNPDGAVPFSLLEYKDIARHRSMINYVIEKNIMPPWLPDTIYVQFKNCRALTEDEKVQILNWVADLKEGDSLPNYTLEKKKDEQGVLTLEYPQAVWLEAKARDTIIDFEFPYSFNEQTDISQIILYSSDMKVLHHVALFVIDSVKLDPLSPSYKYNFKFNNYSQFDIAYVYGPGNRQDPFDAGYGVVLPKSGLIKGNLHVSPVKKSVNITFGVKFVLAPEPIKHNLRLVFFEDCKENIPIDLEPGSKKHYIKCGTTNEDIWVKYTQPHMHIFGSSIKSYAVTPANDTVPLAKIDEWDFYKQEFYEFQDAVFIPKDSKIYTEAWFDNSSGNPYNPFYPPIRITEGWSSFQEMLGNVLLIYRK